MYCEAQQISNCVQPTAFNQIFKPIGAYLYKSNISPYLCHFFSLDLTRQSLITRLTFVNCQGPSLRSSPALVNQKCSYLVCLPDNLLIANKGKAVQIIFNVIWFLVDFSRLKSLISNTIQIRTVSLSLVKHVGVLARSCCIVKHGKSENV